MTIRQLSSRSREVPGWLAGTLAIVSLGYLGAGIAWAFTGTGFPFGPVQDPLGEDQSLLGSVDHETAWPYVAGLAVLGLVTAAGLLRQRAQQRWPTLIVSSAVAQGVLYAVVIPDGRPLIAAAHVPVLLAGKPAGWPPGVTIASQLPWPVVHQFLLIALGLAWLLAALLYARAARGACVRCGLGDTAARWAEPEAALRWGRWAVIVAMAAPALYASSRLAWALDIPYGVTREFLTDMRAEEPTIFIAGALIALLALGGSTLTFGLIAGWGERWPRWIPYLRERPVPPLVAIVPSMAVAALLFSAGRGWYVSAARGNLPEEVFGENWATVIFGATLSPWGLALGAASYAYWLRRRGRCPRCGRGSRSERIEEPAALTV